MFPRELRNSNDGLARREGRKGPAIRLQPGVELLEDGRVKAFFAERLRELVGRGEPKPQRVAVRAGAPRSAVPVTGRIDEELEELEDSDVAFLRRGLELPRKSEEFAS